MSRNSSDRGVPGKEDGVRAENVGSLPRLCDDKSLRLSTVLPSSCAWAVCREGRERHTEVAGVSLGSRGEGPERRGLLGSYSLNHPSPGSEPTLWQCCVRNRKIRRQGGVGVGEPQESVA